MQLAPVSRRSGDPSSPPRPSRRAKPTADWETMPTYDPGDGALPWRRPLLAAVLFFVGVFLYARWSAEGVHSAAGVELAAEKAVEACGRKGGCRFLVPTIIGEQESRAQHHLVQLSHLAHSLNRTLVLPNLATSRFMTCGTLPFSSIYSVSAFPSRAATVPQSAFERWLAAPGPRRSARALRLRVANAEEPHPRTYGELVRDETLGGQSSVALCLDAGRLDFGAREHLLAVEPYVTTDYGLLENIRALDEREGVEVLLVNYDLRAPLFGRPTEDDVDAAFVYAEAWHVLADAVLHELGGAVGVHWRTEEIEPERLGACGDGLVDALVGLGEGDAALRSVYIATDYPLERLPGAPSYNASAANEPAESVSEGWTPAHSDTLSASLTPAHAAALSSFLAAFAARAAPAGLTLRTYRSLLPSLLLALPAHLAALAQTPAAPAIVSQLVLRRTAYFLAGEPKRPGGARRDACARSSNWTRRVVRARRRRAAEERGEGRVVGWWSTDGKVA
ncbi:hypothetical protein JCM10450v2_004102 [Rhodotorula kratochvilovae]